jgi:4-hydroxythreonine-4-phosphate dehydrogenase
MMNQAIPRILITPGEPAGVGPDITIQIAQYAWDAELVVIADPHLLSERAQQMGLPLQLIQCDLNQPPVVHQPGILRILPVALQTPALPGKLNIANAKYVISTLDMAASLCESHMANALVTGPVHKGIINQAGIPFTGHTEHFASYCQVAKTVMLFITDVMRVALLTTHVPLAKVSSEVTKENLRLTLSILNQALIERFHIEKPRILVCGLNPHAGESGYLGKEEIETITPTISELAAEHMLVTGPLPADTVFTPKYLQQADVILAMYHDQALPLVKYVGFGNAVNVTLGLPFIRTSVDHGTAIDVAGTTAVDAGSMMAAMKLAIDSCHAFRLSSAH